MESGCSRPGLRRFWAPEGKTATKGRAPALSGGAAVVYSLTHDDLADAGRSVQGATWINDPSGNAQWKWCFTEDMAYRYSATQNNGRTTQQKEWVSGEEVTYQYDALQRLISAVTTGPEWGLSFSYEGFGNKTAQAVTKGSAPTAYLNYNAATNRITTAGFSYDANGNLTQTPSVSGMSYDVENRLLAATGEHYRHGPAKPTSGCGSAR